MLPYLLDFGSCLQSDLNMLVKFRDYILRIVFFATLIYIKPDNMMGDGWVGVNITLLHNLITASPLERCENAKNSQKWPWRCSTGGKMSQDQCL